MSYRCKKITFVLVLSVLVMLAFKYFDKDKNIVSDNQNLPSPTSINHGTDLPDGFPRDFPVYPGSIVTSSYSTKNASKNGVSVRWEVKSKSLDVIDFFASEFEKRG